MIRGGVNVLDRPRRRSVTRVTVRGVNRVTFWPRGSLRALQRRDRVGRRAGDDESEGSADPRIEDPLGPAD
jgi:hypothetical protein